MRSWAQFKGERLDRWTDVSRKFEQTLVFVTVVYSTQTTDAFHELGHFINKLAADVIHDPDCYDRQKLELVKKSWAARKAMRMELKIDDVVPISGS
jgi:hypothetical protein